VRVGFKGIPVTGGMATFAGLGNAGGKRLLEIEDDQWVCDTARWTLIAPNGRQAQLSLIESQVVRCLLSRCGEVVTREELLAVLHRPCLEAFRRNLDVTVSRLRKKVAASCEQKLPISSARGQGYAFYAPAVVIR